MNNVSSVEMVVSSLYHKQSIGEESEADNYYCNYNYCNHYCNYKLQ